MNQQVGSEKGQLLADMPSGSTVTTRDHKHYPALDGLRGLAILLVFMYHYSPHRGTGWLVYLPSGSWIGVDIFFVLSGFLITGILYDTKGSAHFLRNFYVRRALRLFPIYAIFIAVVLLITRGPVGHSWLVTLTYLLYGSNIIRFFQPDFTSIGMIEVGHLWSLAVEEQFYMLWPWIVILLASRRRILSACLYGCAGALFLRLVLAHLPASNYEFLYLELPTRGDSLLAGAALAMLVRDKTFMDRLSMVYVRIAGIAAALVFVAMCISIHSFSWKTAPVNTWGLSLIALASASTLLLSLQPGSWTNLVFSHRTLRFFGKYSYGLYLLHYTPAHYLKRYFYPHLASHLHSETATGILYFFLILAASSGLAVLSFHFIEAPFLRLKSKFEMARR